MNNHETFKREWDRLVSESESSKGSQTLELSEATWRMSCEMKDINSLGCSFSRLTFQADSFADVPIEELKTISAQLAERLTYLLEPISPIETDAEGCTVQLRSNPPHRDENGCRYYELLVQRCGQISLCRFNKPAGEAREVIPAHVTREVFERLLGDFLSVLD